MKEIEISHDIPPIYIKLHQRFGAKWDDVIIAYNGKIHCARKDVPPEKVIHEAIHLNEQEIMGNDTWWQLYFDHQSFRLEQEVMAHRAEVRFIRKAVKNRDHLFIMVMGLAKSLSSPLYDVGITEKEAYNLIK